MKVLIIEDEKQLSDVLVALLKQYQYAVDVAYDGVDGEEQALSGIYDVVLLDIMLPKKNGLDVLRTLRQEQLSTPILLLTAKADVRDKIAGLDLGADDYLTKPFSTGELTARIRALTRRKGEFTGDELALGDTVLNRNTYEVSCQGEGVKLSGKEFQILEMLLQNSGQILPKERMIEKIWGFDSNAEYNNIEVYISFIRKKLSAIRSGVQIKAVRGVGYTLEEKHDP